MIKRIFFDQDGTLRESAPGIKHSARKTLEARKRKRIPYEKLDFIIGPPLLDCFRRCGVPEERLNEAASLYRHFYGEEGGKYEASLYPGILDLLKKLKEDGNHLYIATSKEAFLAKDIAKHFGFAPYFDDIFGASLDGTCAKKKDILAKGLSLTDSSLPAVRIGDTYLDREGAKANSILGIGVDWGYGDKEKRKECGAWKICSSGKELGDVLSDRTPSDFTE